MGKIEVDSVEDQVIAGLEAEAMLHGRTLAEHVRALLGSHVLLRRDERLRIIDDIRAMTPKGHGVPDYPGVRGNPARAFVDQNEW